MHEPDARLLRRRDAQHARNSLHPILPTRAALLFSHFVPLITQRWLSMLAALGAT